jgi:hypothetical protein
MKKGTTLQFNPSFDEDIIERALAEDPERYGAEYLKWRDDLSTWLSAIYWMRLLIVGGAIASARS